MRKLTGLGFCILQACGASQVTAQDEAEVAAYTAQQQACFPPDAGPADVPAITKCIHEVRMRQCAVWAARFDASVCP